MGLNVSELIRQAVQGLQPKSNNRDIDALIERVNALAKKASDALDESLAYAQESNKRIKAMNEVS